ncbi:prolyl 4-hydroxylase subunit alpha-2-like [Drosophila ficusphila]|uniref:prolyl 4-hydroxylase subunit alpha-2-like n=1 Tax=Drosophila ficusphila TaxID=30025 RepID=UPI0007E7A29F|nr:prolyl 4-hydroxylase subunit alpha-2-like [Drosophila ficusphila]
MPLLALKEQAVKTLRNYVLVLTNRLSQIKLFINQLEELLKSKRFVNPFLTFKVHRMLYLDCKKWLNVLKEKQGLKEIAHLQGLRHNMPTKIDYEEAIFGMNRLQSTYKLDPAEMSVGFLRGKQYRCKKLSYLDCLTIGYGDDLEKKFQSAERWFKLALQKYYSEPKSRALKIFGWSDDIILRLLMKATQSSGRYKDALQYAKKGLSLGYSQTHWQDQVSRLKNLSSKPEVLKPEEPNQFLFKPACLMEYPAKSNLHCRLLRSTPFLQLAPIKAEELSLDPSINIYHNLIDDREIALLKNLSNPHLSRSKFYTYEGKVVVDFSNLRTCKTMRLKDNVDHKLMKNLNQRIMDATGLSMAESEELQISNYGIGGHLYEHEDASRSSGGSFWKSGHRIITALYYLSDVEQGGETVFPFVGIRVRTQKGSLLVWNNLVLNGTSDWRSVHISCPILMGDKWIATKWFREHAQMFIRPCPLKINAPPEFNQTKIKNKFFKE